MSKHSQKAMIHFKIEQYPQFREEIKDVIDSYSIGEYSADVFVFDKESLKHIVEELTQKMTDFINENYTVKPNE